MHGSELNSNSDGMDLFMCQGMVQVDLTKLPTPSYSHHQPYLWQRSGSNTNNKHRVAVYVQAVENTIQYCKYNVCNIYALREFIFDTHTHAAIFYGRQEDFLARSCGAQSI